MEQDPFKNFGEQQRSYELLEEHRQALAADARELHQTHPMLQVVGLILEADASEATAMRAALEQATGQNFQGRGFLGVAPRSFARIPRVVAGIEIGRRKATDCPWSPPESLATQFPLVRRKWQRKPDPRPPLVEAYLCFHEATTEFARTRMLGRRAQRSAAVGGGFLC